MALLRPLVYIARGRRQFEKAKGWYRKRLAIEERLSYEHGQAATLHQLGMMAEEHGNRAEAVRFYGCGAAWSVVAPGSHNQ